MYGNFCMKSFGVETELWMGALAIRPLLKRKQRHRMSSSTLIIIELSGLGWIEMKEEE